MLNILLSFLATPAALSARLFCQSVELGANYQMLARRPETVTNI